MKKDKDDNAYMNESMKLFYFFLFIAFILWAVWYFILKWLIPNIEHQGLTGDLFWGY
ncbi:MAG: hypothetical protein H6629_15690 [Calditrichae bacterium]|nr:hypothetical protein [Calditrichia bacterium]